MLYIGIGVRAGACQTGPSTTDLLLIAVCLHPTLDDRHLDFSTDRNFLDHQDLASDHLNLAQAWMEQNLVFGLENSNR